MVHGGGHHGGGGGFSGGGFNHHQPHHQHHQHSNRNGWSSNRSTPNVVVVNHYQQNPNSWYTGGPWWSTSTNPRYLSSPNNYSHSDGSSLNMVDDDTIDLEVCCHKICCHKICGTCCAAGEVAGSMAARNRQGSSAQYVCLSIVILVALLAFSQLDKSWTLNAGETRHVKIPVLNSRINISSDDKIGVRVYDFVGQACPSLTGPTVTLEDQNTLNLGFGDYQYDYFYLNKGSVINMDFNQAKGATNIYILRGERNLKRIEGYANDDDDDLSRNILKKQYVSEGSHATGSFQFKAKESNVYIIVYDNASMNTGILSLHYTITLTTYNLNGQSPVCDESMDSCSINLPHRNRCILVQAISDSGHHTTDEIVTVEVAGTRRWFLLMLYSASPFLFFLFRSMYDKRSSSYHPIESSEPNPPPTAPDNSVEPNPPPTAPHSENGHFPSAPVVARMVEPEQDYSGITIIPAENVIPVPPPTDK